MFSNINSARFVLCTIALTVLTFIFCMVVHGNLLMPYYNETPALWRTADSMHAMFGWCLVYKIVMSAVITYLFTRHFENKGLDEGVRFGFYIGLLLGVVQLGGYMMLPISGTLAVGWFVSELVFGVLAGVILSLLYKN